MPLPATLAAAGICLRPETAADIAFTRALYAESRAAELARTPWDAAARRRFIDRQFDLQQAHLLRHHPAADRWIVEQRRRPIGRLYVDRDPAGWHLLEIAICGTERGRGIGSGLIVRLLDAAALAGALRVSLHVARDNVAAQRLYRRLGFVEAFSPAPTHWRMIRTLGRTRSVS